MGKFINEHEASKEKFRRKKQLIFLAFVNQYPDGVDLHKAKSFLNVNATYFVREVVNYMTLGDCVAISNIGEINPENYKVFVTQKGKAILASGLKEVLC